MLRNFPANFPTPAEKLEQRVSFVYGMLGFDSKLTKDEVRAKLIEIHGAPPMSNGG